MLLDPHACFQTKNRYAPKKTRFFHPKMIPFSKFLFQELKFRIILIIPNDFIFYFSTGLGYPYQL